MDIAELKKLTGEIRSRLERVEAILAGEAVPMKRRGSRVGAVETFLAGPFGLWRTASEIAAGAGMKPRTVSWALAQLFAGGKIVRREDGRYALASRKDDTRVNEAWSRAVFDGEVLGKLTSDEVLAGILGLEVSSDEFQNWMLAQTTGQGPEDLHFWPCATDREGRHASLVYVRTETRIQRTDLAAALAKAKAAGGAS